MNLRKSSPTPPPNFYPEDVPVGFLRPLYCTLFACFFFKKPKVTQKWTTDYRRDKKKPQWAPRKAPEARKIKKKMQLISEWKLIVSGATRRFQKVKLQREKVGEENFFFWQNFLLQYMDGIKNRAKCRRGQRLFLASLDCFMQ